MCEEKHFLLGQSIIHSEWSSGSESKLEQDCNQPDSFSFPIRNRACGNSRKMQGRPSAMKCMVDICIKIEIIFFFEFLWQLRIVQLTQL